MPLDTFRRLAVQVGSILERQMPGADYTEIEPLLFRLAQVVESNPELRDTFEREFTSLLSLDNFGAPEILQYAMHTLRWPAVEAEARRLMESSKRLRTRRVYERIYESFDPDWEDRDLFVRYRGE